MQSLPFGYKAIPDRIQSEITEIETFTDRLNINTDEACDVIAVDGIPRDGQQLSVDEHKAILICIHHLEDLTVQQTIKTIEDTAKQTDLNRNIDIIVRGIWYAWGILEEPLMFGYSPTLDMLSNFTPTLSSYTLICVIHTYVTLLLSKNRRYP